MCWRFEEATVLPDMIVWWMGYAGLWSINYYHVQESLAEIHQSHNLASVERKTKEKP